MSRRASVDGKSTDAGDTSARGVTSSDTTAGSSAGACEKSTTTVTSLPATPKAPWRPAVSEQRAVAGVHTGGCPALLCPKRADSVSAPAESSSGRRG